MSATSGPRSCITGRETGSTCEDLIVPGYEPFLLCDFHVHTRWSDGRLTLRDTIDLYGRELWI